MRKYENLLPANRSHIIEGKYILMRPISQNEINERYVAWLNDPQINRYLEVRNNKQTIDSVISYINSTRSKKECEVFAIYTKKDLLHIGNVSITSYNPNNQRYASYGIMIGDIKAQELGWGGEVLILIIEYLFKDPLIIKIAGSVVAEHEKAMRSLDLLGFKREGVLRRQSVLSSGKITDLYLYGLLCEEWEVKRKTFAAILKHMKIIERGEML